MKNPSKFSISFYSLIILKKVFRNNSAIIMRYFFNVTHF